MMRRVERAEDQIISRNSKGSLGNRVNDVGPDLGSEKSSSEMPDTSQHEGEALPFEVG
jgi:hypothetical protein